MSRSVVWVTILMLACTGCSHHDRTPRPASRLTEAQRDSAIARSTLPGAGTVGRAMELSGQGAARSAALDTLPR